MKKNGLIRIDEVGRLVIPKEMRKVLKLDKQRLVELYIERDKLIIKKYSPLQSCINRAKCICEKLAELNNCICFISDTSKIICVSGRALAKLAGKKITPDLLALTQSGAPSLINAEEGGKALRLVEDIEIEYNCLAQVPIEQDNCILGSIVLIGTEKGMSFSDCDIKLLELTQKIIVASCIAEDEDV